MHWNEPTTPTSQQHGCMAAVCVGLLLSAPALWLFIWMFGT